MKDCQLYNKDFLIQDKKECLKFLEIIQKKFKSIRWRDGQKPLDYIPNYFPIIIIIDSRYGMGHGSIIEGHKNLYNIKYLETNNYDKLLE